MADIEASFRGLVKCTNERNWADLPKYMCAKLTSNGQELTPEVYAARSSDYEVEIDAITMARGGGETGSGPLGVSLIVKLKPDSAQLKGHDEISGKTVVTFMEQRLCWFTDGKLAKVLTLMDPDVIQRQLHDPTTASHTPDRISEHEEEEEEEKVESGDGDGGGGGGGGGGGVDPLDQKEKKNKKKKLSTRELDAKYRTYMACINERTMQTELAKHCHARLTYNGAAETIEDYADHMREAIAAIPDIYYSLHTVVADEATQRVVARLEFTGTPVATFAGIAPNGRGVSFCEHVTYRFQAGKIARVWSIVDLTPYRQQMSQERVTD
ncbi:SnoaL-domain-containing protein [Xylariomycetidae sp. FL2044]|nr:SnoaL-domain-containing protein [Xylariomycetidae sp. FL2044]